MSSKYLCFFQDEIKVILDPLIRRGSLSLTIAYFFHDEGVEADLVNALVQTVGLVDLLHLLVEHHLLRVWQLRAKYPVVELLWE